MDLIFKRGSMRKIIIPAITAAFLLAVAAPAFCSGKRPQAAPEQKPAIQKEIPGKIAFVSNRDGNREIYVMNADGTGQTRLTNNKVQDFSPAWSPDGKKLAFLRGKNFPDGSIYVMNADGSNQAKLEGAPMHARDPAWSPDGSKIAFACPKDAVSEICVIGADGKNLKWLTDYYPDGSRRPDYFHPAWPPDGKKIAFSGEYDIYVMDADGKNIKQITKVSIEYGGQPAWSPDGKKIAFSSRQTNNGDIYVINADGSGPANLTNMPEGNVNPSWSPDGKRIVFESGWNSVKNAIVIMNADGSGKAGLTSEKHLDNTEPAWQP